jgi:hypothetical protein
MVTSHTDPTGKPYHLTFDRRQEYLYARIAAPAIDRTVALDYFAEVAHECANVRCKKLLIERDIPSVLPEDLMLKTMKEYVRMSEGVKVAFVNPHQTIDQGIQFMIKHGVDFGGDFKYFSNADDAHSWLLAD